MPSRMNKDTESDPTKTDGPMASGRIHHPEKITVYVSPEEWISLEDARLNLRRSGIVVDRGRLVRAAIASALAELTEKGTEADIVTRLGGE